MYHQNFENLNYCGLENPWKASGTTSRVQEETAFVARYSSVFSTKQPLDKTQEQDQGRERNRGMSEVGILTCRQRNWTRLLTSWPGASGTETAQMSTLKTAVQAEGPTWAESYRISKCLSEAFGGILSVLPEALVLSSQEKHNLNYTDSPVK